MTNRVKCAYDKGYRVDKDGNVIGVSGKILKLYCNHIGKYERLTFSVKCGDKHTTIGVHKLMAYQKFGDEALKEGVHVRHLNGISTDNSYDNIAIGTASQNMMDIPEEDRVKHAILASKHIRKFSDEVVAEIKEKHKNGVSYNKLMKEYGISSKGTMSYIINNKYKTSVIFSKKTE